MTLNGNRTVARVIVSVVGAVVIGLITIVVASQNRITAVEVRVQAIEGLIRETKTQAETNRVENRQEHQAIKDKLDEIAKEIRK